MNQLNQTSAKEIRESLKLSQAKVANETGINRAYISQYESGRRVMEDRDLETLEHFYIQEGWDPMPLDPEQPPMEIEGFRYVDGFIVTEPESEIEEEQLEALIQEYYDNAESINEMRTQPVEKGFLFGGLDKESTTEKALPLLTLYARQYQIKETLQGRSALPVITEEKPVISNLGEFVDLIPLLEKADQAA